MKCVLMNKKTIVIDMDDVITTGTLTEVINEYLGTNYKEDDFTEFYKQDVVPDKEAFFKYFLTKSEYNYGKIASNAVEVIKELSVKYEVFIGTSFIFKEIVNESGILVKNKYDFFKFAVIYGVLKVGYSFSHPSLNKMQSIFDCIFTLYLYNNFL